MNKIFLTSVALITAVFISIPRAFALGPATVYKVQVSTIKLCTGSNSGCTTVFSGTSSTIDIASVSSSSVAGNFVSGVNVPDGTYTECRVTPSATFTVSGNDGTHYTTATLGGDGTGSVVTTDSTQQAPFTITLTGANVPSEQVYDFTATPITVKNGVADHKIRVIFDVSQSLLYVAGSGELYLQAPSVTFSSD